MRVLAVWPSAGRCLYHRGTRPVASLAFLQRPRTHYACTRPLSTTPPPRAPASEPLSNSTPAGTSPIPPPQSPLTKPTPNNNALLLFCLSTGLVDSLTFAVSGVWCAFVTGTTVQLGMDLPALLADLCANAPDLTSAFTIFAATPTSERLAALSGFLFGGFTGSRLPHFITPAISTAVQSALLAAAGAVILSHPGVAHLPDPHITLSLISTSMSLQAALVQRLKTPYATSVAWTSVWLSAVAPGPTTSHWKRFAGLAALMAGGTFGAAILRLWKEDGEEGEKEVLHRMGWGLVAAGAVKGFISLMLRRRGKKGLVQL
ncbi:uncharacterized protein LAESUDRAFT_722276 [Laetiporus sulphureus 93-53]|uniref:DUF1275 domain protein n=1 Tax=Laetiporus sulphureus 93-53 TaxID=1314785 RepID=A0A165GBK6_9APHY|nr:uncharacterized protein LAESUDRAFT_722276 [Laetiporus sulphureus 93-53]KZT10117.1 hypothetical protein LAESUDRAFT_722276 [Laetiporus sulphureus 93-53]